MADRTMPENLMELLRQMKADGVPKEEYKYRINTYLAFKARGYAIPYNGIFELTPLCNLDCRMCYVHLNRAQMNGAELLSAEQWKELIRQAKDAGMRNATLTGGECLTYPDFDEIYLYLQSFGIDVSVFTNGVMLNESRIDFFRQHPPLRIQITLYGSCNAAYERVTGFAQFDTVWNNILRAREAKLPLSIAITPNAFMEDDAEALLEKVQSLGVAYRINTNLFDPRENTGRQGPRLDASLDTYIKLYKKDSLFNNIELTPVKAENLPDAKKSGISRSGFRCGAGRSSFSVNWQGRMFACTNIPTISEEVTDAGFQAAWEKINRAAKQFVLPAECDGCAYEKVCVSCPAAHLRNGSAAHCDPSFCDRARRLVEAGIFALPEPGC